jgi:hypothetical protein
MVASDELKAIVAQNDLTAPLYFGLSQHGMAQIVARTIDGSAETEI